MTATTKAKRDWKTTGTALLSDEGRKVAGRIVRWRCPICGRRMSRHGATASRLTLDHVVAHKSGGDDRQLVPMCGSCNSSKRDRDLGEWLPGRLVTTGRASTLRGAKRVANRVADAVACLQDELSDALVAEGIWE